LPARLHRLPRRISLKGLRRVARAQEGRDVQVKIQNPRRLYAGLLIAVFGLAGVFFARNLQFGTAAAMGPGFLPTICSWMIVVFGVLIMTKAFTEDVELIEPPVPRPVLMISLSIGLFALLVDRAGLGITVFVTAFVASYAGPAKFVETLILSAATAVATVILFVTILGLTIPVWPEVM
jgi:hypothetical protein